MNKTHVAATAHELAVLMQLPTIYRTLDKRNDKIWANAEMTMFITEG